jgi:TonB-dependent receptor
MIVNRMLLSSAIAAALAAGAFAPAVHAQQTTPASDADQTAQPVHRPAQTGTAAADQADAAKAQELQGVTVTGVRASLQSAQQIKMDSDKIVDSIVAEDIGKLPDLNVSDALQRITGVQIERDLGEGGAVAIRGLPQVQTTLNGRELFTAGGGRTFNTQDFPSELLRGINVYKSSSADLVEGGLGGTIDLITQKPFDFEGFKAAGAATANYGDQIHKAKPDASFLVSNRWNTSAGEFGALLSASYQERAYRQDLQTTGSPFESTTLIPGQTVIAPNGTYNPTITGDRKRKGLNGALQWRPSKNLEFYAEGNFQDFTTKQEQRGIYIPTLGLTPQPGSATTFGGGSDLSHGTYLNPMVQTFGTARDTEDKNTQYALGGKWFSGPWTLDGEVSYSKSKSDLEYSELDMNTTADSVTQDLNSTVPSTTLAGAHLLDPSAYTFGALTRSENHFTGNLKAGQFNAEYATDGFITSVKGGLRYTSRESDANPIRFFESTGDIAATNHPGLYNPLPYSDYFSRTDGGVALPRNFLTVDPSLLRDFDAVRQELGMTTAPATSPLSAFKINEKTEAGYLMANFAAGSGVSIDGNVGVRVIRTRENVTGNQPLFINNVQTGYTAIDGKSEYTDYLPSFNARIHFTDTLQLKLAASKGITRPDFSNLSPSLTLVPANGQAASGNPALGPLRAKNYDASLEWYFAPASSVYGALFYKSVDGFISQTVTPNVVIDGITYNLAQPVNGDGGQVRGAEFGYQQFFDFLPGWLSGFGMQANYTYVDSVAPSAVKGLTTTLPSLSKNSYNLVGIYEKGPWSIRAAYNWRSKFYQGLFVGTGSIGPSPIYRASYGWLDASVSYDINKHATLVLSASNLLRTRRQSYYTFLDRPNDRTVDDREVSLGIRVSL